MNKNTENTVTATEYEKNTAKVQTIGRGEKATEEAVTAILATVPEGFDPKAKGALPKLIHVWATGTEKGAPQMQGSKGKQVPTNYGLGVDRLRKALAKELRPEKVATVTMRLSLSGEGGGTVVIEEGTEFYAQCLKALGLEAKELVESVTEESAALVA